MSFEIRRLTTLEDYKICARIDHDAFLGHPLYAVRFPKGFSEDMIMERAQSMYDLGQKDKSVVDFQVIDLELNKPIAFTTIFLAYGNMKKEISQDKKRVQAEPGSNVALWDALSSRLQRVRERWIGQREHVYFRELATDPQQQRRGAGTMLVKKAIEIAESQQPPLPIYLLALEDAYKTYHKCGFRDLETLWFDLTKYGGEGAYGQKMMLWETPQLTLTLPK